MSQPFCAQDQRSCVGVEESTATQEQHSKHASNGAIRRRPPHPHPHPPTPTPHLVCDAPHEHQQPKVLANLRGWGRGEMAGLGSPQESKTFVCTPHMPPPPTHTYPPTNKDNTTHTHTEPNTHMPTCRPFASWNASRAAALRAKKASGSAAAAAAATSPSGSSMPFSIPITQAWGRSQNMENLEWALQGGGGGARVVWLQATCLGLHEPMLCRVSEQSGNLVDGLTAGGGRDQAAHDATTMRVRQCSSPAGSWQPCWAGLTAARSAATPPPPPARPARCACAPRRAAAC